ncbi:hypothetical protein KGF57_002588 [Candida theae]|uniref:DNA replication factor Cdt1 C-terminal domain-containing protein n=1 Tax=Candida theae TaxID=1198502 RepID=A0AAD5BF26_9ASCO|nr:uncharacterized protein KGF57_002588 [Candida theae]KAI5958233.1 hypothetical protein KGF57_002588 [Candida theae]
MNIANHDQISKHVFNRLVANVKYIDSTLALHYIHHVAHPPVHKILEQASQLAQWKISIEDLENILAFAPMYKIYRNEHGTQMSFPGSKKRCNRVAEFTTLLNEWISSHQGVTSSPSLNLCDVWIRNTSPKKVTKSYSSSLSLSPTKQRANFSELKNSRSKFTFKEKNASQESEKHQGLSLLERIKKKEELNKAKNTMSKEEKHVLYLAARMDRIYNVIHQLYLDSGTISESGSLKPVTISFTKIVQVVRDTCDESQMDQEDIYRIVELITKRLDSCKIHPVADIKVLRVSHLNRSEDLTKLNVTD